MTPSLWLQAGIIILVTWSIVRALKRLPKRLAVGFATFFILVVGITIYMALYQTDTLIKWVEFIRPEVIIGGEIK